MTTSGAVLLRSGTTAPPVSSLGVDDKLWYVRSGVLYYRGQDGVEHNAVGVDPARVLTAGAGLTGGGDLSADRTFDVVAGDTTIVVNANELHVGKTLDHTYVTDFDTQVRLSRLDQMAAPNVDVSLASHKLVSVSTPTASSDVATKGYVDTVAAGLSPKISVASAQTAASGGNLVIAGVQTIDGIAGAIGQRVLLTAQTLPVQNGIWLQQTAAWTRPADFASGSEASGAHTFVEGGTLNTSSGWVVTGEPTITVDTNSQTWTQFSGAGEVSVDATLTKAGNQLSRAAVTSDISVPVGSNVATLPTVNSNVGPFGDASHVATFTVNGKGLTTAAGTALITPAAIGADVSGAAAAAQAASQPLDADLTTIAGLTATTANIIQSFGSAWASRTPTQVTSTLDVATQSLKGLMSAADKAGFDHDNVSLTNILDFAGDGTATNDNATPMANALAALPASGGVIGFPVGSYLLGSNFNPAGRSLRICGDSKAQSNIVLTHATADGITFNSGWYSGMENIQVTGLSTQTTGVLAGGEASVPVAELKNFPTSGSASFGGTAGWVTISWTGKSVASGAGNLTGCTGVTAAASGVWVMIRTGGYAIRLESNYCNLQNVNCYAVYDGVLLSSALGFLDTVEVRQVRNNATFVDGALADKFINRLTTASSPLMEKSININLTSSLLMTQCQILNGKIGLDFNPPNGGTIPSVEVLNTFFDNCTIGMRVTATGTGSSYRSKFTNCWFSSASTAGVQFNTTQFDGFSFVNCDFYGNGKGIDASIVGGGHWMLASSRLAQNTTAIHLAGSAAHFPMIIGNEIGPTGAFGANTTGITVVAGTYKGLIIQNNAVINNTTNATLGAVTIGGGAAEAGWYRISDNAGINPLTGAAVTTPAVPASTAVVTNTTGRRVSVFVKWGATTAPTVVTVNGVAVTAFIGAVSTVERFVLDPGGTFAVTYTVAFTWVWVGN